MGLRWCQNRYTCEGKEIIANSEVNHFDLQAAFIELYLKMHYGYKIYNMFQVGALVGTFISYREDGTVFTF